MSSPRTVTLMLDRAGKARGLRHPAFKLRVVRGKDRRKERRFEQRRVVVGSSEAADFRLGDETVSGLHCELTLDETGIRVRDLGSRNGVHFRERPVVEACLEPGDDVVLGTSTVRVELDDEIEQALTERDRFGRLRGSSLRMREVYDALARATSSEANVLLRGETGTGKELAAEALFTEGPRSAMPFVVIDCGALTSTLAESELFGHEAGAFTGATKSQAGAFERADGGTVFLDEIGELPLETQAKLLGVLERREVKRIGGGAPRRIDVRVIAATHRDLEHEVNRGTFRADLFFRLCGVQVRLPALREHPEDIPELVAHILEELGKTRPIAPAALQQLYSGGYPGNVRELWNAVERVALGFPADVPPPPASVQDIDLAVPFRAQKASLVVDFERRYLRELLDACQGNVSEASRRSGLDRVYLHRLLQRHRFRS